MLFWHPVVTVVESAWFVERMCFTNNLSMHSGNRLYFVTVARLLQSFARR